MHEYTITIRPSAVSVHVDGKPTVMLYASNRSELEDCIRKALTVVRVGRVPKSRTFLEIKSEDSDLVERLGFLFEEGHVFDVLETVEPLGPNRWEIYFSRNPFGGTT